MKAVFNILIVLCVHYGTCMITAVCVYVCFFFLSHSLNYKLERRHSFCPAKPLACIFCAVPYVLCIGMTLKSMLSSSFITLQFNVIMCVYIQCVLIVTGFSACVLHCNKVASPYMYDTTFKY